MRRNDLTSTGNIHLEERIGNMFLLLMSFTSIRFEECLLLTLFFCCPFVLQPLQVSGEIQFFSSGSSPAPLKPAADAQCLQKKINKSHLMVANVNLKLAFERKHLMLWHYGNSTANACTLRMNSCSTVLCNTDAESTGSMLLRMDP